MKTNQSQPIVHGAVICFQTSLRIPVKLALIAAAASAFSAHAEPLIPLSLGYDATNTNSSLLTATAAPAPEQLALAVAPYARAGWQATLSTLAHSVRGTVTIVDADTFRVDNFFYDGGGIDVHFILAASNNYTVFSTARLIADSLPSPGFRGQPHNGDSVTIDLPAGQTLDGYNAVSLWCIPAQANFGSGTFVNTVPEPTGTALLAFGACMLARSFRRRARHT